jgi:hypothetical protein
VKAPRDFYILAISQVSSKERNKTTMVTKNWTSKVLLSRFLNNAHEAFLLCSQRKRFLRKNVNIHEKMHVAILSKVD